MVTPTPSFERALAELSQTDSLDRLLPLLFTLRGKPYSLDWSHFMFKPMFEFAQMPRRSMLKCGRQVSKCCVIGGRGSVYLANGEPVAGDQLQRGDQVLTLDEASLRRSTGTVVNTYRTPSRAALRIQTRMGTVLDVAHTHPIRTAFGYVEAGNLTEGTRVAALREGGMFGPDLGIPTDRVRLTAFMIGDGCCGLSGNFNFVSNGPEAQEMFVTALGETPRVSTKAGTAAKQFNISKKHQLREWLTEDGLWGHYSYEKFLPGWVFRLSRTQAMRFVECLWATDGMVKPRGGPGATISYCSTSSRLAYGVKALLLKFGIMTTVKERATSHRNAFLVRVEGHESQARFISTFHVPDKPSAGISFPEQRNNNRDTLPAEFNQLVWNLCDQAAYRRDGSSLRSAGLRRKPKYPLSLSKVERYLSWFDQQGIDAVELKRLHHASIVWDEVESITPIADAPCWDIEVAADHNFVLDGVITHNSTSLAAAQIMRARFQEFYNIVTVMPLFEQVRKFSSNYVRPFITSSPFSGLITTDTDSVMQKQFPNGSSLYYSYSSGDPNRVRGVAADECNFDEVQDLDMQDLPIIESCMSASPYKIVRYTGTPKTFDNTIQLLWEDSSQAHWHIKCGCGKENRATMDDGGDLINMIGDGSVRMDGKFNTLLCAKCGELLNSRTGYYIHYFPERRKTLAGHHVPQPVLPMHYESPKDWMVLLEVMRDKPKYIFYNEVLGESFDAGAKILTIDQIRQAAQAPPCMPDTYDHGRFIATAIGVDWGGRGKEKSADTEDFISNTAIALVGMRPDGVIEVRWLHKIPYTVDHAHETEMVANVGAQAHADWLAVDYGGQGNVQEEMLTIRGVPKQRIVPFTYAVMSPTKPIVHYAPGGVGSRSSYTLDKPRSILLLCELIKAGKILFPKDDKYLQDHLLDFLSIYEEMIDNPSGSPRRLVKRQPRRHDDIVHAINFAVMALFNQMNAWPGLAAAFIDE